jgi:membrane protein involved in colicin uptake
MQARLRLPRRPKPAASAPRLSGKDKELEEKKKQAEAAEAAKKKADQERVAKIRAENCERAKKAKASLDSGVRIATTNAKGERDYMTDAARAAESKRLGEIAAQSGGRAPVEATGAGSVAGLGAGPPVGEQPGRPAPWRANRSRRATLGSTTSGR